jgi:hypothetical protein
MHWPYRWFWKSTAFLPDRLFARSFNFVYGQGSAKRVISWIIHWLRAPRAAAWKAPAEAQEN